MSGNGKKGLWLALAISVFVLVVLGAAFFLFAPSKSAQTAPFDMKGKAEAKTENPSDYLEGQQGITGDTPATQTTTTNASGDIIILYGDQPSGQASGTQQTGAPASRTTQVAPPSATPSPSAGQTSSVGQSASSGANAQSPAVVSPPKTTTTVPQTAKPAPKPAATTATTAAPKSTPPKESAPSSGSYWIQAGSFRTKSGADSLMGELQKKNIQAKISVKDIDGKSYYQVKVGPYASREDAKKWLKTVVAVPGVSSEAFVTQ